MKKVSYFLETWDHSKLWFAKNWWFTFGLIICFALATAIAIIFGLKIIELTTFLTSLAYVLMLTSWLFIIATFSERIRTYGNVNVELIDDGKIKFDCKIRQNSTGEVSASKIVKPNKVVPFHGFILVQEKWSNYAFMSKEAAIELGIYKQDS